LGGNFAAGRVGNEETAMELKGTKTHDNLKHAFAGESQANRRYLYFARVADIEGYPEIGGLFRDTSEAETGHAFGHMDFLKPVGDPATDVAFGSTRQNLQSAIEGETYEYTEMYPGFAVIAREEGFPEIAAIFMSIAVAEKQHEKRYLDLLANIENNRVFRRDEPVVWRCRNCGYLHTGTEALDCCPACNHPRAHFEILGENY
jgi:rubrerythrin